MPKSNSNPDKKICVAALRLAASRGWKNVTLDHIARTAKIPLAHIKKRFAGKNEILPLIVNFISDAAAAASGKPDRQASPHDRLFDALMTRFDVLQKYRQAILSIMREACLDSGMMCALLPAQKQAMQKILTRVGLGQEELTSPLAVIGLWVVYGTTLRVWQSDEAVDMAKTMAALDRALRFASKAAEIIFRAN